MNIWADADADPYAYADANADADAYVDADTNADAKQMSRWTCITSLNDLN